MTGESAASKSTSLLLSADETDDDLDSCAPAEGLMFSDSLVALFNICFNGRWF